MDIPSLNRDELFAKWRYIFDPLDNEIWSWTTGHECAWLAECASNAKTIVEIGSYHGRSAKMMALAANPVTNIYCIDNFENVGCEEIFRLNLKEQIESGQVSIHRGTSDLIEDFNPEVKFDFAFIDAGHMERDVEKDIKNILTRMASGGIVSGHDWRGDMGDGVNLAVVKAFGMPHVYESIWSVRIK